VEAIADVARQPQGRGNLTVPLSLILDEAAKLLHLSRVTVYNEINTGYLPAILGSGAKTLLWRSDIEEWLNDRYTG
jgi:excisionase family DNA binding protein